ncbi:MAG: restriction endonuclease [Candidatus Delongbacteria bacterium]|nr:restriction endonuclease [Candidatus Delongbacteria bacterium]
MIPDFQSIMLPFLEFISDEREHSTREIHDHLAGIFGLTADEINRFLPSGSQKTFTNRIAWAKAYLKMAGLLQTTKRGYVKITESGKAFLGSNPSVINVKILRTLPAFLENYGKPKDDNINSEDSDSQSSSTPEEILESSYVRIRRNLSHELLQKIKNCSPAFFENLVVELLVRMGYGGTIQDAGQSIGQSGDEGIDGIIKEDRLGLDVIYIQAKRWEGAVGRPEIQKFMGALAGQGAKKGVFITTSRFTNDARSYQPRNDTKIVLIDGEKLAELMIDYNLAVSITSVFEIKRIDNDYFEE